MLNKNDNIMNNFKDLYRMEGFNRPKLEGSFIEGSIVSKQKNILTVYTGLKRNTQFVEKELQLSHKKITQASPIGTNVHLYTHSIENRDGESVFNPEYYYENTKILTAWNRVSKLKYAKGIVLNTVNGGFSVGMGGFVTFLPRSRAKLPKIDKKEYVHYLMNHYLVYKIVKVNYSRRNIVVSLAHNAHPSNKK
jgi:ribosomal protein S1